MATATLLAIVAAIAAIAGTVWFGAAQVAFLFVKIVAFIKDRWNKQ
jgi:hypothetical protein